MMLYLTVPSTIQFNDLLGGLTEFRKVIKFMNAAYVRARAQRSAKANGTESRVQERTDTGFPLSCPGGIPQTTPFFSNNM